MELELNRIDYTIVGVTSPKCMNLLPPSTHKGIQKVVVGDQKGVLYILSTNKSDVQVIFKTPPGPKITRIELGGPTESVKDKIFVSSESEVRGFTKKGKQFLEFDTNLTESINAMCVIGNNLFVTGQYTFNHYLDLADTNSFICNEVINDFIVLFSQKTKALTPILACNDRVFRVLESSHLLYSIPVQSNPTVILEFSVNEKSDNQIIYGTSDGGVGLLSIGRELNNSWLLEPDYQKGQVTCLDIYDLTGDGVKELIIGTYDGYIEVYKFGEENESLKLIYSYNCNEIVTCLICGVVGNNGFDEILVSTYSGRIFGLTTEVLGKNVAISIDSNNIKFSQEAKQKINRLKTEIAELEEKIVKEREKYQTVAENNENALSTIPAIAINDKFYLVRKDASYIFSIEVQTPIDNVLIQSDVPVDLLDIEKNSAVVSFSDCSPADGNFLLATYRCQLNTTRLDLNIRTIEGQYGTLQVYVTPNIQPKCCQMRSYKIKPLSLHSRIYSLESHRPYNVLNIQGGFSLAEIHSCIEFCLPEVPSKPPPEETVTLIFGSTFLNTMLQCTYSKGRAEFKSDNISTISILKDVISKEMTRNEKKKRNLNITWQINVESVKYTLDLLRPKLENQLKLQEKITILESMSELDLTSLKSERELLTNEYLDIINNEKQILDEHKKQPAYLERLYGMITDLFIDKYKFTGENVRNKIPNLLEVLNKNNYSYNKLLEFFNQ